MLIRYPARSWVFAVRLTAVALMTLYLISFQTQAAAQDLLVNCNEVSILERCDCNQRILRALTNLRTGIVDGELVSSAPATANPVAIQQARQHRLRTFYAPDCKASSPAHLPTSERHTTNRFLGRPGNDYASVPLRTQNIEPGSAEILLVGRWEGWQTLFGGKPSPVSFHVTKVAAQGLFVTACSEQGMVFARLKDGYLELPRSDSSGGRYSIRLWRSGEPNPQDLEGVALLEMRPGETLVAGLVWFSRTVRFDWTTPPSSYFCQDLDLEEHKRNARAEQARTRDAETMLQLAQLEEQVRQLRRELDAVRFELELSKVPVTCSLLNTTVATWTQR